MILWRICDVCSREFLCFESIAGVFASCSGFSCRLKHAIDQHAQATIEFRLPERFSKDWRIPVTLPQPPIPSRDEGEWDALGIEPLGDGVCCFAMFQLDVEQRRIAFGRFDQRECVRNPNGRAQYETSMSSDRILPQAAHSCPGTRPWPARTQARIEESTLRL